MKDILKTGAILLVICLIAGISLGAVYRIAWSRIEEQQRLEKEEALKTVMPLAESTREANNPKAGQYYEGLTQEAVISYAKETTTKGYGGKMGLIVGVSQDKRISGVKVLYHSETPGLGARAEEIKYGEKEAWFLKQFIGKEMNSLQVVRGRSSDKIEAITGATISSEAVTKGAREVLGQITEVIENE